MNKLKKVKSHSLKVLKMLTCALILFSGNVKAQIYVGITGDLGNRVHYSPETSFFKRPLAPSASLILVVKEHFRNDFFLEYDFALSALGYIVKPAEVDTITVNPGMYFPDRNYNNLYVNVSLSFGKHFYIGQRKVSLTLGGGLAYFLDTFGDGVISTWYTWDGSSFQKVFEYETHIDQPKLKGFAQISTHIDLSKSLVLGLRFIYQFNPAITGTYSFFQMSDPPNGNLKVAQRSINVVFLYKLWAKHH